jgi:non-ribosomal peptide synthetase component F
MPFEKLVDLLRPSRDLARMPLFQVMFSFLDTPMPALTLPGLAFEILETHNRSAKFDLDVVVVAHAEQRTHLPDGQPDAAARGGDLTILLEYSTDLYNPDTMRGFLRQWVSVLRAAVARPWAVVEHLARPTGAQGGWPAAEHPAIECRDGAPTGVMS